jgi:hypothetical protein
MPKHIDTSDRLHPFAVKSKHKVGTRKSATSAHRMTTVDLLAALENPDRKKFRSNILHVLNKRNVTIPTPVMETSEDA